MKKILVASILVTGLALNANAEGIYVGVGLGQSSVDISGTWTVKENTASAYKIFLGNEFTQNIAVESGYFATGNFSVKDCIGANCVGVKLKGSGFFVDAVGKIAASPSIGVFGKIGVARIKLELSDGGTGTGTGLIAPDSVSQTKLRYGLGGEYSFNKSVAARFEYEVVADTGDDNTTGGKSDLNMTSLGLTYKF